DVTCCELWPVSWLGLAIEPVQFTQQIGHAVVSVSRRMAIVVVEILIDQLLTKHRRLVGLVVPREATIKSFQRLLAQLFLAFTHVQEHALRSLSVEGLHGLARVLV